MVYNVITRQGGGVKVKEYALYKGDELLIIGTISEIAEERDVKEATVKFYMSPTYLKRTSENALRLIEIEDDI